jgi:hypothetical protein
VTQNARHITVGVLLDARIQEGWVLESVRQALAVPTVKLAAVALACGRSSAPFASRFHRTLDTIDTRVRCSGERLFARTDVAAELGASALLIRVAHHRDGWCPDEAGTATLRRCHVDAWLCFAAAPPRRPLDGISRLGVWALEIGPDIGKGVPATSAWAGAMEIAARNPVTRISVVDYAHHRGGLLYQSRGATVVNSARNNRLNALRKGLTFFRRLLDCLMRSADLPCSPRVALRPLPAPGPALREPTVTAVARLSWRLVSSVVANQLHLLSAQDQWQIAYHFKDEGAADFTLERLRYLVPPRDRFWADPFGLEHLGRYFILFEELSYRTGKGRIMAVEVFEDRDPGDPQVILERPYHLSYPFVFAWEGYLFLLPETEANRTVELYRCEEFPRRWCLHKVLLEHVRAFDPTLWEEEDRWWMFVNIAEPEAQSSDELHLYWSPTPLGPWIPHPRNPVISDACRARPAGPLFSHEGNLYRPSQDCCRGYGASVLINRVNILREDDYQETMVKRIPGGWRPDILRVHSFGGTRRLRIIDCLVSRKRWQLDTGS